ncbi:hypothetical protein ADUPG1_004842, partial [Aduncisulcus paluster]
SFLSSFFPSFLEVPSFLSSLRFLPFLLVLPSFLSSLGLLPFLLVLPSNFLEGPSFSP